jgi:hypothetical protein
MPTRVTVPSPMSCAPGDARIPPPPTPSSKPRPFSRRNSNSVWCAEEVY